MNIKSKNMWPEVEDLDEDWLRPCYWSFSYMLEMRRDTYQGFAEIEAEKGLLQPLMSMTSTHGQEAMRILIQRGFEEIMEAIDSEDRDHFLEELIDAINYFWVLAIIDNDAPLQRIKDRLLNESAMFYACRGEYRTKTEITSEDLGELMLSFAPMMEKMRNRSWMNNSQSSGYFDGWPDLLDALSAHLCLTLDCFDSWQEFIQFYIAKDNVLQFRLSTNY